MGAGGGRGYDTMNIYTETEERYVSINSVENLFANRVVSLRKKLLNIVVTSEALYIFNNRLNLWHNKDLLTNYQRLIDPKSMHKLDNYQ